MESFSCLKCSAPLKESDFNLELGVAKCSYCDAWFKVDELKQAEKTAEQPAVHIPVPDHFQIKETQDDLLLKYSHQLDDKFRLIGSSLIALVICMVAFFMALAAFADLNRVSLIILVIGLFFAARFMKGIRKIDNEEKIVVQKAGQLARWTMESPRPALTIPVNDIKQLYCTELNHQLTQESKTEFSVAQKYNVNVLLKDDTTCVLVDNMENKQDVLLIEHRIEQFLGIPDEPVAGEVS